VRGPPVRPASLPGALLLVVSAGLLVSPHVPAQGPLDREAVLRRAQEIATRVAAARGLRTAGPIRADVLSRDELVRLVRRRLHEESPPEEIRAEGFLLERLGMIDSAAAYEDLIYDMYEQQVAGLYDPDDRATYVLADLLPWEADLTLWHEIVHALQDATFHVGDRQDALEDEGDEALAYAAVCEGDATITSTALQAGMDWSALEFLLPRELEALRSLVVPPEGAGGSVPVALLELLSFPYVEGVAFVRAHFDRGGTAAIDDLFRRPPRSTEQVIHPEKYGGADRPIDIHFAEGPGEFPGYGVVYDDTAGEFLIRVWLDQALPAEAAARAAAGWGGDRIGLLLPGARAEPACAEGAFPLDDRLWACGAAPDCGADLPPIPRADAWIVWATVWDPAPADHPRGAAGEAIEFQEGIEAEMRRLLGAPATPPPPEGPADGAQGSPEGATETRVEADADGAATWTLDVRDAGVAAVRRDGRHVHVAIGPAGRADAAPAMLDGLAAVVRRSLAPAPPGAENPPEAAPPAGAPAAAGGEAGVASADADE
jgi:hypothetical protein